MRLARLDTGFAVDCGDGWTPLAAQTTAAAISEIRERGLAGASAGVDDAPLACPVVGPSKIVGVGFNYAAHAEEVGAGPHASPVLFGKFPSALTGPFDPVPHDPEHTRELDYEVELAAIVGARARHVSAAEAEDVIFGYAVANDVSARDLQAGGHLARAKGADGYLPLGPWIVTPDELARSADSLGIRSWVNGEPRQDDSTASMTMTVGALVEHIAGFATLEVGDVILTGSPEGSGRGLRPARYLRAGDTVACEIDGIGRIESRVEAIGA